MYNPKFGFVIIALLCSCGGDLIYESSVPPTGKASLLLSDSKVSDECSCACKIEKHYMWDVWMHNVEISSFGVFQRFGPIQLLVRSKDQGKVPESYFIFGSCVAVVDGMTIDVEADVEASVVDITIIGGFDCGNPLIPKFFMYNTRIHAPSSDIKTYRAGAGLD
jgi:hypothetical protein